MALVNAFLAGVEKHVTFKYVQTIVAIPLAKDSALKANVTAGNILRYLLDSSSVNVNFFAGLDTRAKIAV